MQIKWWSGLQSMEGLHLEFIPNMENNTIEIVNKHDSDQPLSVELNEYVNRLGEVLQEIIRSNRA